MMSRSKGVRQDWQMRRLAPSVITRTEELREFESRVLELTEFLDDKAGRLEWLKFNEPGEAFLFSKTHEQAST